MIPVGFSPLPAGASRFPSRLPEHPLAQPKSGEPAQTRTSSMRRSEAIGRLDPSQDAKRSGLEQKTHEAALQFEGILVRELLAPLEKSLGKGIGDQGASPMVGGMIVNSLSQSIIDGGGLGLAAVIEESMRESTVDKVSSSVEQESRPPDIGRAKEKPEF